MVSTVDKIRYCEIDTGWNKINTTEIITWVPYLDIHCYRQRKDTGIIENFYQMAGEIATNV